MIIIEHTSQVLPSSSTSLYLCIQICHGTLEPGCAVVRSWETGFLQVWIIFRKLRFWKRKSGSAVTYFPQWAVLPRPMLEHLSPFPIYVVVSGIPTRKVFSAQISCFAVSSRLYTSSTGNHLILWFRAPFRTVSLFVAPIISWLSTFVLSLFNVFFEFFLLG